MNKDELSIVLGQENIPLAQRLLEIGKKADSLRKEVEKDERDTMMLATTAMFATGATLAASASLPFLTPLALISALGISLVGVNFCKIYLYDIDKKERATLIARAFTAVSPAQWQELFEACHCKADVFLAALGWGMNCAETQGKTGEAVYRSAREYLGDAGYPVPGYQPKELVPVIAPKKQTPVDNWEPGKPMLDAAGKFLAPKVKDANQLQIAREAKEAGDKRRAFAILINASGVSPDELDAVIGAGYAQKLYTWANSPEPTKPAPLPSAQPTIEVLPPVSNAPVVIEDAVEDVPQPSVAAFTDALLGMDDDDDCDDAPASLDEALTGFTWKDCVVKGVSCVEPKALNDMNRYPVIMIVAPQGNGKTCTLSEIFSQLDGHKALHTTKADDHRNPNITSIYDLTFGYDYENDRGCWFGEPDIVVNEKGKEQVVFDYDVDDDFDARLEQGVNGGTSLEFAHLLHRTAVNREMHGRHAGRRPWHVFYDEAANTYMGGFSLLDSAIEDKCKRFISARYKPAFLNFRASGVQVWFGCQSESMTSLGLVGLADVRNMSWHLYPGTTAILIANKYNKRDVAESLENLAHKGYAIALLERDKQEFEIIKLPKLSEFKKYDPIEAPMPAAKPSKVVFKKPIEPVVEVIEDGLTDDGYCIEEIPVLPSDPGERVKLASDLLKEYGTLTIAQIREINPQLEQYFKTLAVKYPDKHKKSGDTYSYAS